jgi:hypothetical protein
MSLPYHPNVQVRAGTTWSINGLLLDANGNPLDITNCALAWGLLDMSGNPVPVVIDNAVVTKTDPVNGAISITIAAAYTKIDPARYTDTLEVTEGNNTELFWTGFIVVNADPFAVPGV